MSGRGVHVLRGLPPIFPLCCASATFALTQSMLNPSLPAIQADTGTTPAATTWLVTIFFLVSAVSAPVFGRLGDMFGRRTLLTVSLGTFTIGALVAAVGAEMSSLPTMITGRAVQGLSGGIFPLALAHARAIVPKERLPGAIGVLSATVAIGAAAGVAVGGAISDGLGYPSIFWWTAASGTLTTLLVLIALEGSHDRHAGRVDLAGAALLSIGVGTFLVLVSEGPKWGWRSPLVWGLIALVLAVTPYWLRHERRHPSPIVDVQLARRPALLRTNVASVLTGFGLFGSLVLTPQLVQRPELVGGLGLTAAQAGLIVMPTALCNFLSSPIVGAVAKRFGPKPPMVFGCLVSTVCLLLLGTNHGTVLATATWTALLGIGTGCVFTCTSSLVLDAVEPAASGQALGVNVIARSIGASMGTQVGGIVLATHMVTGAHTSSDHGFLIAFLVGATVTFGATVVSLTIPARRAGASLAPGGEAGVLVAASLEGDERPQ